MTTRFDADLFTRAWLAVGCAAAKDANRPQLNRTTLIELFPEGARLLATDSCVLLTAFVPASGRHPEEEPGYDEAPVHTAIAADPHGRARQLCGHLLALAKAAAEDEHADTVEVRMSLGVLEDGTGMLEGFSVPWVILDHPDKERLKLSTYEGAFPLWRPLLAGRKTRKVGSVTLAADLLARVAKAATYLSGEVELRHLGPTVGSVGVDVSDGRTGLHLTGLVAPISADGDLEEAA
jgi:hypothetical protein